MNLDLILYAFGPPLVFLLGVVVIARFLVPVWARQRPPPSTMTPGEVLALLREQSKRLDSVEEEIEAWRRFTAAYEAWADRLLTTVGTLAAGKTILDLLEPTRPRWEDYKPNGGRKKR